MKKLTGYPSIDNIHNGDYSFFSRNPIIPNMSIYNTINLISNFYRKEEAIDCLDLRVNYDEMIKDAITLSKTLKELGVKKGDIVSVAMPNFYQGVIVYLACNRIGAITTFINSMSSIEEVLGYLNEFESSLFINFDKDKEYNKKIKDGSKVRNIITLHSNEISTKNYSSIETGANGYNDDLSFSDIGSIAKYYKKPIYTLYGGKEDSLILFTSDNDVTFSSVDCLNFIDAYITPHTDENGRYESTKEEIKNKEKVGIMLSNCSCIEIVDNEYRIITSEVKAHNIKEAYALRGFYQDGKYYEEKLEESTEFKSLEKLLSKN